MINTNNSALRYYSVGWLLKMLCTSWVIVLVISQRPLAKAKEVFVLSYELQYCYITQTLHAMQGEGQHGFIARKGQVGDWLTGVSCQRPRCHQVCHRTVHVASVLCGYAWRQPSSSTMQLYPTQTFWAHHLCTVNVCLCWIQLCLCWIQLHGRGRWLGLTYKVNSLWLYLYLHVQQQPWIKSKNMIKHWNQTLSPLSGCIEQELQNDKVINVPFSLDYMHI